MGYAEGIGRSSQFNHPHHIALDSADNLYGVDADNFRVRKIAQNGTTTLIAGTGISDYENGAGAGASFRRPVGIAVNNSGTVYVADKNDNRIRKIDAFQIYINTDAYPVYEA